MISSNNQTTDSTWFQAATRPDVVKRSTKVSLLVGTILVAINQGNLLVSGGVPLDLFWKIPLTFCVPYAVSTYAAVDSILSSE